MARSRARAVALGLLVGLGAASELRADPTAELRRAIEDDYSHRDLRAVDWGAAFDEYAPRLRAARTSEQFATLVGELLGRAKDVHITVRVGDRVLQPFVPTAKPNFSKALIAKLVPDARSDHRCVSWGHAGAGVGYLVIGAWTPECAASAQAALDGLSHDAALVIDVRANSGGDDALAGQLAGRFIGAPVEYALVERIAQAKTTARERRSLEPNRARSRIRGAVIVLMGPACMSSNESFLLMMRAGGATLMGEPSFGSSGNPRPHPLSNGVVVNLPSWRALLLDGTPLEGRGVRPDVVVSWPATPTDDVVLRAAVARLQQR
jgi:hypothetical protein